MLLSCVLPAFNEAGKLVWDIPQLHRFLHEQSFRSEILIVDDGSEDSTAQIASKFSVELSDAKVRIRSLSYAENRGKGYAVRFGMLRAEGQRVAFLDVGACVDPDYIHAGLKCLEQGADLAIASRKLPGARVTKPRPLSRRLGSEAFRWITKVGLGIRSTDSQCGFKIFRREAARSIFSRMETDGFMFDVELLLVANQLGLRLVEFPVEWKSDVDTRFHPFWGSLRNAEELIKIRMRSPIG